MSDFNVNYANLKRRGQVQNFQDLLTNWFKPLFEATLNPSAHPELAEVRRLTIVHPWVVIGYPSIDRFSPIGLGYPPPLISEYISSLSRSPPSLVLSPSTLSPLLIRAQSFLSFSMHACTHACMLFRRPCTD